MASPLHSKITWKTALAVMGLVVGFMLVEWWFSQGWAIVYLVLAIVVLLVVGAKQEKRKIEDHFSDRTALTEKEFGAKYFPPDRAEIAAKLRQILARHAGIDISRMEPGDRFIEDLRMDDYDSMSTVEYVIEIEEEFKIKIDDAAAGKMKTFQDLVDYVAGAINPQSGGLPKAS